MQVAIIERKSEQEHKTMKFRVIELEKKLEDVTRNLVIAQSTIATKDSELSMLQNNLRELEELREMKEVKFYVTTIFMLEVLYFYKYTYILYVRYKFNFQVAVKMLYGPKLLTDSSLFRILIERMSRPLQF